MSRIGRKPIEIPAGVTSLGANAFAQCASLTSVEFEDTETNPAKLTKLSGSTFKEKWRTYWTTVKMMVIPLCVALLIMGALYLFFMYLGGGFG